MTLLSKRTAQAGRLGTSPFGADIGIEFRYIFRFVVVGVLNTAVGLGTIYAAKYFFSFKDVPANGLGYLVGLINSFLWNRNWTFSHSGSTVRTMARFVLVFAVAYLGNLVVMLTLISRFHLNTYLANALATIPYTVTFYLGSRYFVFVRKPIS
jgi:putative flippase GtrA